MEVKKGFVASSFDIMHPGYALMLKECKDMNLIEKNALRLQNQALINKKSLQSN